MGSGKKHKKESKKKKHRDRSSSVEREKHRHHKRHHKKRHLKDREESAEDSDDDVIIVPPPPKISRQLSPPPPPSISVEEEMPPAPPPPSVSSSSSAEQSLSIAETNKLRAKLGLKPLAVGPAQPVDDSKKKPASQLMSGTDMGDFVHRPADNIAAKLKAEKLKAKLAEKKERREIENKLSKVKKLAEDSDDDDTSAWIMRSRKIEEERKKAEKKAKELDDMDAVFGIGDLVEDEMRNEKKIAYTNKDLRGLKVEHDIDRFTEGREVVLTLKDRGVLDEDGDTLVNVNMLDDEHYRKNIENRKKNPFDYNALDDEEMDVEGDGSRVLKKYDEEIEGAKKQSFTLGVDEVRRKKFIKQKLEMNKKLVSLEMPAPQLASEYYTDEEIIKFKKPKKKVRKLREKKKILKADDLLPLDEGVNGGASSSGVTRGGRRQPVKEDPDDWDLQPNSPTRTAIKAEIDDMDVDDLAYPEEDLSGVKLEADDSELEIALRKARKLKQKEALDIKSSVEKIVERVKSESADDSGIGGAITLNSTAEFCRTLGDIPTYGLAGNRDEEAQEILDFDKELLDSKSKFDEQKNSDRGGWNDVEMDDGTPKITPYEAPILDAEPDLGKGVGGALRLAVSKGYLEKETTNRPSASRFAHLQAQNYSIEDKTHVEDDKFGRRERYCGPTSDFREKDNYKPNVKLDYIDDDGHLLCAKEAFRYLSHKFHGKGPGKNKVEKRMKKNEQEVLMKQMSSTDTPLGTLNMLQQKQKETQSAFVVLSGSKHNQTPATISKTKI